MRTVSNRAKAAIAALALGGAAAVVAIAARAPLVAVDAGEWHGPSGSDDRGRHAIVGIGVVMLGALTVLVWSGRRRKHEPPQPEPPPIEVHWIWKLLAILLLLALGAALVAAAVIGSKRGRTRCRSEAGSGPGASAAGRAKRQRGTRVCGPLLASLDIARDRGRGGARRCRRAVAARSRRRVASAEASATSAAVEAAIGALDGEADPRRAVSPRMGRCSARSASMALPGRRRKRRASTCDGAGGRTGERARGDDADRPVRGGSLQLPSDSGAVARGRPRDIAIASGRFARGWGEMTLAVEIALVVLAGIAVATCVALLPTPRPLRRRTPVAPRVVATAATGRARAARDHSRTERGVHPRVFAPAADPDRLAPALRTGSSPRTNAGAGRASGARRSPLGPRASGPSVSRGPARPGVQPQELGAMLEVIRGL